MYPFHEKFLVEGLPLHLLLTKVGVYIDWPLLNPEQKDKTTKFILLSAISIQKLITTQFLSLTLFQLPITFIWHQHYYNHKYKYKYKWNCPAWISCKLTLNMFVFTHFSLSSEWKILELQNPLNSCILEAPSIWTGKLHFEKLKSTLFPHQAG